MLKINLSSTALDRLVKRHSRYMLKLIKKRLSRTENAFLTSYFSSDKLIIQVLNNPSDNLVDLSEQITKKLLALPISVLNVHNALKRTFSPSRFFDKKTPKYNAYHLCDSLGLKTCPYCNIMPISTIITWRPKTYVLRPPLDHFFAATLYPMLAISFFNLVPSCEVCNSRFKHKAKTGHLTHLNPYVDGFNDDCVFSFSGYKHIDDILAPNAKKYKLSLRNLKKDVRFDGNSNLFKLDLMYGHHADNAKITLHQARKYSGAQIRSIKKLAIGSGMDPYQYAFDAKFKLEELHEQPFSKLKRDIVNQFGSAALKMELGI